VDSGKIYLSKEEQIFLMDMFEIEDPLLAAEEFASLLVLEKANPLDLKMFLEKIMIRFEKKYGKN